MSRCLCCNKEMINPSEYESRFFWHEKCIKSFFGTKYIPELDCSDEELERLVNLTVNKGLTVPGVQKKLSLHLDSKDRTARLTIVDYPAGYVLKPQSTDFSYLPESEFLSMKMAEAARIRTVPNAMILTNGRYSYITRRIDRERKQLLAMEDFCQLSGRLTEDKYRGSYENCGRIIKKYSRNTGLDLTELYYRLLFCFLTGNSDMHLKNFSLIEDKPGSRIFGLSPAYDLLPVNIIVPSDNEQMALTLNGKKKNIRKKDLLYLAQNFGLEEKVAINLMRQLLKYIKSFVIIIDCSYISEKMKEELKNLISTRAEELYPQFLM